MISSSAMQTNEPPLRVGESIRLRKDIPELWLFRDDIGVVVSTWCYPITAYEVEFDRPDDSCRTRALVMGTDLQPASPATDSRRS